MLALGLSLLLGYGGQISLGHSGFFGIGAYTVAILTTKLNFNPWLAMLASLIISSFSALIIGFPILKLRGYFLALATLGFGEIVYVAINEARWLTKGPFGISDFPNLSVGTFHFDNYSKFYYLVWLLLALLFIFSKNLVDSREGRALRAISSSETVASTLGINVPMFKIKIFVLSAGFAGIAGSLYAFFLTAISPADFTVSLSILIIMMVIIGGVGSLWGAILGAFILTWISEFLSQYKEYSFTFYGFLLIILLIFMPNGIYTGIVDASKLIKSLFRKILI
jgi:branched-chain amino acid transport system permease protein